MGTWHLEVAKMVMYMAFPVGLFYYFNQPEYFEDWVVKTRREIYPPEHKSNNARIQQAIQKLKEIKEQERLKALEDYEKNHNK